MAGPGMDDRLAPSQFRPFLIGTMESGDPKDAIVEEHEIAEVCLANAYRVLEDRPEHRPELAGRTADYLQHLGGRSLPLARFGQFASERPDLLLQISI